MRVASTNWHDGAGIRCYVQSNEYTQTRHKGHPYVHIIPTPTYAHFYYRPKRAPDERALTPLDPEPPREHGRKIPGNPTPNTPQPVLQTPSPPRSRRLPPRYSFLPLPPQPSPLARDVLGTRRAKHLLFPLSQLMRLLLLLLRRLQRTGVGQRPTPEVRPRSRRQRPACLFPELFLNRERWSSRNSTSSIGNGSRRERARARARRRSGPGTRRATASNPPAGALLARPGVSARRTPECVCENAGRIVLRWRGEKGEYVYVAECFCVGTSFFWGGGGWG